LHELADVNTDPQARRSERVRRSRHDVMTLQSRRWIPRQRMRVAKTANR
jgi:hypothetical protein